VKFVKEHWLALTFLALALYVLYVLYGIVQSIENEFQGVESVMQAIKQFLSNPVGALFGGSSGNSSAPAEDGSGPIGNGY
jgi:hypothetical protein